MTMGMKIVMQKAARNYKIRTTGQGLCLFAFLLYVYIVIAACMSRSAACFSLCLGPLIKLIKTSIFFILVGYLLNSRRLFVVVFVVVLILI